MADKRLREALARGEAVVAPGVYDMLSALIADRMGFTALYITGFGISASHLGMPDAGYATYTDMQSRVSRICEGTTTPIVADADTGFGGLLNVAHTVRGYEKAGVSAIQLEAGPLAVIENAGLERTERRCLVTSRAVSTAFDFERFVIELALVRIVVTGEAALEASEVFLDETKAAPELVGSFTARMTALAALSLKVRTVDFEERPQPVIEAIVRFGSGEGESVVATGALAFGRRRCGDGFELKPIVEEASVRVVVASLALGLGSMEDSSGVGGFLVAGAALGLYVGSFQSHTCVRVKLDREGMRFEVLRVVARRALLIREKPLRKLALVNVLVAAAAFVCRATRET
ncbi:MAG: isocitrate lyase/PEP mutase family protein [Planctomycetota bacterium]